MNVYIYIRMIESLLYSRNWHVVNQLYFDKKEYRKVNEWCRITFQKQLLAIHTPASCVCECLCPTPLLIPDVMDLFHFCPSHWGEMVSQIISISFITCKAELLFICVLFVCVLCCDCLSFVQGLLSYLYFSYQFISRGYEE